MTVRIYRNTDFGAPQLANVPGEMVAVLNACLIDGYGDQTITITRVGVTATVTTPLPHGLIQSAQYDISGANEADYNGVHTITVVTPTTFTYNVVASPVSPATGTITGRLNSSGWTQPFTDTNKAVYTQGGSTNPMSYMVDDTTTTYATVSGYESMYDIDGGIGRFPSEDQQVSGLFLHKSTSAYELEWVVVATDTTFITYTQTEITVNREVISYFGEFKSYKPADNYAKIIQSGNTSVYSGNSFYTLSASITTVQSGIYLPRNYQGLQNTPIRGSRCSDYWAGSNVGTGRLPYPHPIDNAIHTAVIYIGEPLAGVVRGEFLGMLNPLHSKPLNKFDIFEGDGDLAGKIYIVFDIYLSGQVFVEISDTW